MFEIEIYNSMLGDVPQPEEKHDWVEVRNEMFVHTRGKNPGRILTQRRPNEDAEIQKYRLDIYEPITKGSINRAIDKLYRIFSSANFSIQVSDELSTYLNTEKFDNQYFYSYIQKYVVRRMIEDPNGWLVWIPVGEGLTNPSVKVDVYPLIVGSNQIRFLDIDEGIISWYSEDEKSEVYQGGRNKKEGQVIYTMTPDAFYKHTQIGIKKDNRFQVELIYQHNIGFLPGVVLGGDVTDDDYFESYFSAFLPFANEAIRQYSDWQAIMTTSCFPYREEVAETCSAPGCRDGFCYNGDNDEHSACRTCKGTGRVITRSPFGVFMREKGNMIDGPNTSTEPMIRFIGPPVDVIEYSGRAWETLLKKAEQALNLTTIDEAQSGTAKEIDREDSFIVLTKISNNLFDEIIYQSLLIIEKYRSVANPIDPVIVKPISFSMKTENDLIDEINKLNDKNAPVAFLVEATKDLAKKRFSGNIPITRMVEILVSYDPIYHINTKDKQMLLASGVIKKDDLIRSLYAYKTLTKIVADNGTTYLENDLSVIFSDLDKAMQPIVESYQPKQVIDLSSGSIDVNSEIQQREAEAKANLKGSVGGVQGIIAIQQSVSKGFTDKGAAVKLLMEIYGFNQETAIDMIGDPINTQA